MSVVLLERRGPVAIVTINRPKALNALSPEVMVRLGEVIAEVEADRSLRVMILTGAGGKAFVAGADIAEMRGFDILAAERFAEEGQRVLSRMEGLSIPTIAAVSGFALGGGCELAMACDIVLAGPRARFGQPEVKLGVIPGFGGTQRLVRRVGQARALDLVLTGRMVGADEAVSMGIASRKVGEDVLAEALAVADEIRSAGGVAVSFAKRAVQDHADGDLKAGLAAERHLFALCFASEEQAEGMSAFLEKRPAAFAGAPDQG
ncbi:MAG: enoyl-CoA hydratase/isomerase family protein [Deltaproteobacteria bacterium]|nr:enoyl-CoA hydratase/isomerase family protein [Deltaproteobacteria bacterium]